MLRFMSQTFWGFFLCKLGISSIKSKRLKYRFKNLNLEIDKNILKSNITSSLYNIYCNTTLYHIYILNYVVYQFIP